MRISLFGKDIYITKRWREDFKQWSLLYRTEILCFVVGFVIGAIVL